MWKHALVLLALASGCGPLRATSGCLFGCVNGLAVDEQRYNCRDAPANATCTTINGPFVYRVPVNGGVVLIDTGFEESGEQLKRLVADDDVLTILLTHAHLDHVSAAHLFGNTPVYVNADDLPEMRGEALNGIFITRVADFFLGRPPLPHNLISVEDGAIVSVGGVEFEAIQLPGHTPGSTAWRTGDALFSGDCLQVEARDGDVVIVTHPDYVEQSRDNYRQLRERDLSIVLDGHWGQIRDVDRKLADAIAQQ